MDAAAFRIGFKQHAYSPCPGARISVVYRSCLLRVHEKVFDHRRTYMPGLEQVTPPICERITPCYTFIHTQHTGCAHERQWRLSKTLGASSIHRKQTRRTVGGTHATT